MQLQTDRPQHPKRTTSSLLLDLVRGLAASLVLLEHWRNIFFVDFPQVSLHRLLIAPFYIMCSAGHQAVVIFFILSGYLISGSVFRMLERGTWSWKIYLTHRLLRLWIVLLPGLLLVALWDSVGVSLRLAPKLYGGLSGNHMIGNVAMSLTVKTFATNLLFLQGIVGSTFGSDGALWSLANEFWYYVLFPLGLFVLRPQVGLLKRIFYLLCFCAIAWRVGPKIMGGLPIWLLGTALSLLPVAKLSTTVRTLSMALYVPLFFWIGRAALLPDYGKDYLLSLCTFIFLWVLLSAGSESKPPLIGRLGRSVSRFSFTLYVGHTPLCVLLAALIAGDVRWQPTPGHVALGFCVLGLLLSYAYVVAFVTEFRTDSVRRWLEPKLFRTKRQVTW